MTAGREQQIGLADLDVHPELESVAVRARSDNAVATLVAGLPHTGLPRILRAIGDDHLARAATPAQRRAVVARFELDLIGLLNLCCRAELEALAERLRVATDGSIGELRARLWQAGAELEAGGQPVGPPLQPIPVILRGKLVQLAEGPGLSPPARGYPRPIARPAPLAHPDEEPDTVEELLALADRLVGVRLGRGGRGKGAFGTKVAALLGVRERGFAEADWRGEVEIKTVPVVRDRAGWWRVKEDPAITMVGQSPIAKLRQVLWIARVADAGDSPILSWYYHEWSPELGCLFERHLHIRPKGGAGATTRGWYLHKRFFVESGFLRSLNG